LSLSSAATKIALMREISDINNANIFPVSYDLFTWPAIGLTIFATIGWLAVNDAVWWSSTNASIWSSEIWSSANSQHPLDPYTLTHTMFGILCFWTTSLIAKQLPLSRQFFLAILLACAWELAENSSFFIDRFRAATAAAEYTGDALVNSTTDIIACGVGFYLASRSKAVISIGIFFIVEIAMMFLVRDNLALNVVMIVFPVDSLRTWQLGV
jgi:hypothetical protein